MPYNTTAIPPRKEATGQAQLPLARVKKIIALDAEISMCSTHAAFVMTLAAEMFIQFLAEHGHRVAKSDRKPRRNIQYADIANAIQRLSKTEFLTDVVPRTTPYKRIVERKTREACDAQAAASAAAALASSSVTSPTDPENADGVPTANGGTNGTVIEIEDEDEGGVNVRDGEVRGGEARGGGVGGVGGEDPNEQLEREIRAQSEKTVTGGVEKLKVNGNGVTNGYLEDENKDEDEEDDIEMAE